VSRWTRRKCQRCARVRKLDVGVAGRQPRIWAHRLGEPLCLARLLYSAAAIRTNIIINHHNSTIHAPAPMMATVNKYIHDVSQENYYRQHLVSHASSPLPLLTLHDSRNSMSNHHTSPLNISLRQSTSHTHLQSRLRPPLFQEVFGRRAERERHCFQAGDEDTVC
jgi:hypothetical protein